MKVTVCQIRASGCLLVCFGLSSLAGAQSSPSIVTLLSAPNPVVQGQSVTFTAGVTASASTPATGVVTINARCPGSSTATTLGSVDLSSGSLSVSSLPCLGENLIVASYGGDSTYFPGTSETLIETLLPPSTRTNVTVSSSIDPASTAQSPTFDAAVSLPPFCPFTINPAPGLPSTTTSIMGRSGTLTARPVVQPIRGTASRKARAALAQNVNSPQGPKTYAIDFTGKNVILPNSGSFTYDPAMGFSNFQVQWFGATFDFTAAANNASGCSSSGPALGFALLSQSLSGCRSGSFAPYSWSGIERGEGSPFSFSFSYGSGPTADVSLAATANCPSNSCGNTFAGGTWTIRDASTAPAPVVSCPAGNIGQVGTAFSSPAMSVTGGTAPYAYTVVGTLPAGLTLDSSTGAITGTPTAAGAFAVETMDANLAVAISSPPTGTVDFMDTNSGNMLGSASLVTSGNSGSSKTGASLPWQALAAGSLAVQATYLGDTTYGPSASSLLNQVVQSTTIATTTTLTATPDPGQGVPAGQPTSLTAVVSSSGGTPTGIVSFYDGTTLLAALNVDATGTATLTTSGLTVGNHALTAAYGGDSSFASSASASVNASILTPSAPATTVTLSASSDPALPTDSLVLAAAVSSSAPATPTGTVTFQDQSSAPPNVLGSAPVQNGLAVVPGVSLGAGLHSVMASYSSGDGSFAASAGTLAEVVNSVTASSTSIDVSSSANPSVYGQTISFSATVTGGTGTPSGTVTFSTGAMSATVSLNNANTAVLTTAALSQNVVMSATYSGDGANSGSTAFLGQTVNPASTTGALAVAPNPSLVGWTVTFTATVTVAAPGVGTPTGSVSFVADNSQVLCSAATLASSGSATCSTTDLALGSHTITATYGGDTNFVMSSASIAANVVQPAPQTIAFGPLPGRTIGTGPFGLTATASSGLPVSFASATTAVCSVSGATVTLIAVGTCSIQATQAGNSFYLPATPVIQSFQVIPATQTITFGTLANRAYTPNPFTVSATASSGLPVSFASLTTTVCTVAGSSATLVTVGTCTIQASQAGNATYAPATPVSRSFTVTQATQTINFGTLTNRAYSPTPFNISATASSGLAVSFASATTAVCTVSGSSVTLVTLGTCTIQASQAGNPNYSAATPVSRSFTVSQATQTITFGTLSNRSYSPTPFNISATASSGLPVSFASTTATVCTVSGSSVTMVTIGTCTIQANQAGNTNYAAAIPVNRSFTISKVSQTITFGTLSNRTYSPTPFTVSATASSGLPVSFASTTTTVCTVSGSSVTLVTVGTCTIQASQAGNATYAAAAPVSRSFTVSKASQTITFGALANQSLNSTPTFTVTASATSGLTVSFNSRTAAVCTVSGVTVTLVAVGSCTIQATQTGNANYSAATAVNRSFQVTP
jgi:hypothetical protein